ncbi:MAG: hypothetical protein QOJ07_3259 [Thermoleophilaceae bacterium]|jgi:hypothetical protein|nr:hypothetical protein [Thermoleophilaceae bacterium]
MSDIDARGEPDEHVRLSAHPRAQLHIKRAKSIGGLAGFCIGFWLGSKAGLPAWDTGIRALAGGIAGYLLIWVAAVQVWRQIAIGEFRAAEKRRAYERRVQRDALAEIRRQRAEAMEAARSRH